MIKIQKVRIQNFLSYGAVETEVDFNTPGTILMVGKNGTGKTSIINAVVYCLYDKPMTKGIPKDELVNDINKRRMKVTVEMTVNDKKYQVIRARKMKPGPFGNYVQIFKEGKDVTPDSLGNSNTYIQNVLGIGYELFVRIVTFAASHKPFLDLPVSSTVKANQTDVIEELFDLKILSNKANLLKERIRDNEQSLKIQEAEIEYKKREQNRYKDQVHAAELRIVKWDESNTTEIRTITKKLKEAQEVDLDEQKAFYDKLQLLVMEERELKNRSSSLSRELKRQTTSTKKIGEELVHLENDECPYCLQKLPNAHEKIEHMKEEKVNTETRILELDTEIQDVLDQSKKAKTQKTELKKNIVVDDIDGLLETRSNIDTLKAKLKELKSSTNPYVASLEDIKSKKPTQINLRKMNRLTKEIDHQKFLYKILTKKDSFVRKALLDRNLPYLNKQLSFYLNELELPFSVEFTHEMTARIKRFGTERTFAGMSTGQKSRINLALSFAFRDVLQHLHSKINVCMMDEVLDVGLDTEGVPIAINMLKNRALSEELSLYIISHKSNEIDAFDKKMVITLEDGFSKIIYE